MKRFSFVVALFAALVLSACTQTLEGDRTPATEYNFAVVLTESRYVELGDDADFSKEESVETAQVGEELVFISSHANGPMFVHIRVYDPDGEAIAEEGPFENWDGLSAKRYVLNVTPDVPGRYHFQMVASGENGRAFAKSPYNLYVEVTEEGEDDEDDGGGETTGPEDLIGGFSITLPSGGEVEEGDELDEDDEGFSVNWWVDSSADSVRVTVDSCDEEIYRSTSKNGSRWFELDRDVDDGCEVEVRLRVEEDGKVHTEIIRFDYDDNGSSTASRGTISFDFRVPSGRDVDDVRLRLVDDDGDLVAYVDDDEEVRLRDGRYDARVVGSDFEIDRVAYECTQLSNTRLRFDIEEGDRLECRVYFEEVEDDSDDERCEDAVAFIFYSGNCYEHFVYVSRSGPDFELNWDMSTKYDRYYVQLYQVGVGDLYQSMNRTGSHDIDPSDLASGDYEFRVTGYEGSTADLWTVGIRVP